MGFLEWWLARKLEAGGIAGPLNGCYGHEATSLCYVKRIGWRALDGQVAGG